MKITCVRKEDDIYYQGAFWIVGDSVDAIKRNNFEIVGLQLPCDYDGNYLETVGSKSSLTHSKLWDNKFKDKINPNRSEEHTSELQSRFDLVCRLLLEKKKNQKKKK